MKTMFLAAAAAFLVIGGAAQAKPVEFNTQTVQLPTTVAVAKHKQTQLAANPLAKENPTGLPAYEMRPDGLMINGLLPAQGWEG
jgi:hypothetical protein